VPDDSGVRARALDPKTSFIVQAPAGSGKTELLIQRYLRLLVEVQSPEAVVAITFTRKAAGEMRSRVLEALRDASAGREPETGHARTTYQIARNVLDHDQRLGWKLLANPAQTRIETIDALCASITRQMPWLAQFGAPPDITEKGEELYREAARNTLRHLEEEERRREVGPISRLLLHLDNDFGRAASLIAQMLEKRDQWLRHTGVNTDLAEVRAELERSLKELIVAELERLHHCFDAETAKEIAAIRELSSFPEPALDDLDDWSKVAELLLTKNGELRKRVDRTMGFHRTHPLKQRYEALLNRLQGDTHLLDTLQRFRVLPAPAFEESQWRVMGAVLSVLPVAVGELQLVFRERGVVDFAELSIRASAALGTEEDPTDLALALGYRIEHILVDEFQDTSFTQFALLKKLTAGWEAGDGRTLFLVGDPMQSIYRFRQAEVSLFLNAKREGIGQVRLEPLQLRMNFRSRREIVEWINSTFVGIFPNCDDLDSGAVGFEPSECLQGAGHEEFPAIETHAFLASDAEAERVVSLVKAAHGQKIAILVRARSHLSSIVPALKSTGIRFQAIEIDELGRRPVIQDLMALTFALLHIADRVSWFAVLRAPWCGLTLNDLHALASCDPEASVWDLLEKGAAGLSPDGAARVQRIRPVLEKALAARSRSSLRDWVEGAWVLLGGPACIRDHASLEDAAAYFDLIEGLERGADLEDFAAFREQVSQLFAQPDSQADGSLQLMTIHKAKGLEFDAVILPGLGMPPRRDEPPLLLWQEQAGDLLVAPISESGKPGDRIYEYLWTLEQQKARNETARLLYVAATRARKHLHLLACVRMGEQPGEVAAPASNSFLGQLWPAMGHEFVPGSEQQLKSAEPKARQIHRVQVGWQVPAPPASVRWSRADVDPIEIREISFDWVGSTLRHVGTALHAFLQRIAREGLEEWDAACVRAQRGCIRAALSNLGVAANELRGAAERVESALLQVLRDPKGRWVLERHSDARCEYAITGLIEGRICQAVIDRTFVDDDGVRWVIDYKTSSHEGGDIEGFLDNEKERYQPKLEQYARLLVQQESRPIRLALYFPLLNGWREWAAPTVLRRQASLF
jgi:ATP-dependent exoDNAse (exonuclease V) beta subunit